MHISIIYEDENYIVCDKPAGLPSAPLNASDIKETALSQMIALCPAILAIKGRKEVEYGLVHRIDTATRGLLLAAKNQKSFDSIQKTQSEGKFIKYYTAFCRSSCFRKPPFTISSRFRSFGPQNKMVDPVTDSSGRAAQKKAGTKVYTTEVLEITELKNNHLKSLTSPVLKIQCRISEGFRHQVRAHLASNGLPIIGDKLYGKEKESLPMYFFATGLEFETPEKIYVTLPEESFLPNSF